MIKIIGTLINKGTNNKFPFQQSYGDVLDAMISLVVTSSEFIHSFSMIEKSSIMLSAVGNNLMVHKKR